MNAEKLIRALERRLGTSSQTELAASLGVTVQTLINWRSRGENLTPNQVAAALAKSQLAAVQKAQLQTIRPLAEFYPIEAVGSKHDVNWEVFDGGAAATLYAQGLKKQLQSAHGIYLFYDSRGRSIYVGKAKKQTLWKEMNSAFNRERDVQKVKLVKHPNQNRTFTPGHEKLRQPEWMTRKLSDMAYYLSAYEVHPGMVDDLEALMIRGFSNDLLNVKIERFMDGRR